VVEGTPLLREHPVKSWIEGSNPSVSANSAYHGRFFFVFLIRKANSFELFSAHQLTSEPTKEGG
jgi:hypothetical protein